jgi:hypothetical protein
MRIVGIVLIVIGVVALAMGGISYIDRDKVLDIGPVEATTETRKTIPLSPLLGVASLAGGVILMVAGSRGRA